MKDQEFYPKYSFEVSSGEEANHNDINLDVNPNYQFPEMPKKPLLCACALLLSGIVLFVLGIVEEFTNFEEPSRGIAFWVLGSLTIIPGGYFSFQYYKAYKAKTPIDRMNILRSIPDMN
ncbi:unnamed protein product [Blepharisma stoltei]|uniref:Transmembrane protein 230 n=1 Tax=Blepharisma stoltei TaxID=1481888 RepID=A0AAU9ILF0_9CILI|nr:unnamed protein product [Blepharisma stoltei]